MCAHVAIGASWLLGAGPAASSPKNLLLETTEGELRATLVDGGAKIEMPAMLTEHGDLNSAQRAETLRMVGLDLHDASDDSSFPFLTTSVARPKTLVPLRSEVELHRATPAADPNTFVDLCARLGSTGLYLYTPKSSDQKDLSTYGAPSIFEARQFPTNSGYSRFASRIKTCPFPSPVMTILKTLPNCASHAHTVSGTF